MAQAFSNVPLLNRMRENIMCKVATVQQQYKEKTVMAVVLTCAVLLLINEFIPHTNPHAHSKTRQNVTKSQSRNGDQ